MTRRLRWPSDRLLLLTVLCLIALHLLFSSGATGHSSYSDIESQERRRSNGRGGDGGGGEASGGLAADGLSATCSSRYPNTSQHLILILGGTVLTPDRIGRRELLVAGGKLIRMLAPGSEEALWLARRARRRESTGSDSDKDSDDHSTKDADEDPESMVLLVNATGALVVPGLVDIHVHVTGGGGEAGPGSRVPEAAASQLLRGGVTTVVGVLGMDSVTRSVDVSGLTDEELGALEKALSTALLPEK